MKETVYLSDRGQVMIPEAMRTARKWRAGQELVAVEVAGGIFLKPKTPFRETTLDEVAGCLGYDGTAKTLDDMEAAIQRGIHDQWSDRRG